MENASQSREGKRPYHSRVRQRQAEETHQRLLAVARELFATRGYANTTLEMIAEAAEVSPKTVSAVFGSKRGILTAVVNPKAFGAHVQQMLDELRTSVDPSQRVSLVAQITRQAYEPLVSELELLRTAGAVAPELADLARQVEARRRQNQGRLVAYLDEHRMLRQGLLLEEATDLLWTLTSYDLYRMLVVECRWEPVRYETWLAQLLIQQLLQPVEGWNSAQNLVASYVYPLSYLGLGLLAMKRSPWLATLGIACGLAGSIPWGLFAGQMAMINGMAQMGPNPLFVSIENHFYSNWMIFAFAIGRVIGHQLAYVLLGIALARAWVIPLWAASLIVVSGPVMEPIAYGTGLGLIQVLGYVLVFIGSVPAAIAMLKRRDEQEQTLVPTAEELTPTTWGA